MGFFSSVTKVLKKGWDASPMGATFNAIGASPGKIEGLIGDLTGKNALNSGKDAMARGDALTQQELDLANKQFDFQKQNAQSELDYERGNLNANRALSTADYNRRLGVSDQMTKDANFSPEFYDQQVGGASATARAAVGKAEAGEIRGLGRYGVTPGSGRFQDTTDKYGIASGIADANAANSTRTALGTEERTRKANAEATAIGIHPDYQGIATNNPTLALNDPAIGITGHMADQQYAVGAGETNQGNSSRAGLVNGLFTLGGAVLGGPVGAAIGSYLGNAVSPSPTPGNSTNAPSANYTPPSPYVSSGGYAPGAPPTGSYANYNGY